MEKQYVGKGREKTFSNGGSLINIGIDSAKLPPPNEKGWFRLVVAPLKQTDQWGNTHTVYVDDWKPKEAQPETPANDDMPF